MNTLKKMVAALLVLTLPAIPAAAQDAPAQNPVTLSGDVMAVKTVTDDAGAERTELVEPTKIIPGDRLIFGTDYATPDGTLGPTPCTASAQAHNIWKACVTTARSGPGAAASRM